MNKQEQIEKMAREIRKGNSECNRCNKMCLLWTIKTGKCLRDKDFICHTDEDTLDTAVSLIEAGYINGADFVEWLKEKYGDLFYVVGYAYREQVDLDKALQEYLKGE